MVVTAAVREVPIRRPLPVVLSDLFGRREIERSVLHAQKFPVGNEFGIGRSDIRSIEEEFMIQNRAFIPFSAQIEISVIGEVDRRLFIGNRRIFDPQNAVGKSIYDRHFEISRIIFLPVGREQGKFQFIPVDLSVPELFVEAFFAAVEMIAFVVDIEGVRLSVDFEMPFVDTVSERPMSAQR